MRVVALDFETANLNKNSAISIGLMRMEDGVVLDKYYSLINPPNMIFAEDLREIHGLSEEDVADAPKFKEIYKEVIDFIGDDLVIAHNAGFDTKVFKACCEYYNIAPKDFIYVCTYQLSKAIWKNESCYKLTALSKKNGVTYNAHNALEDSYACGILFFSLIEGQKDYLLHKFLKKNNVPVKTLSGKIFSAPLAEEQFSFF